MEGWKTILLSLCVVAVICVPWLWSYYEPQFRYIWGDCDAIAEGLANDRVWGFRGIHKCIACGDRCLEPLWENSNHLQRLNWRNAPWIAEVLSGNQTPLSVKVASELSDDPQLLRKLVGQVALAKFGKLKDISTLHSTCVNPPKDDLNGDMFDLAAAGIGYTKDTSVLPVLHATLVRPHANDYWRAHIICRSLGNLGDQGSIPVLESYMRDPKSAAPGDAMKALHALGHKNAIPLAIDLLAASLKDQERQRTSESLVLALEETTGQDFGADAVAWQKWYSKEGKATPPAKATPHGL